MKLNITLNDWHKNMDILQGKKEFLSSQTLRITIETLL